MKGALSLQTHSGGAFLPCASSVSNQKRAIRPGNTAHRGSLGKSSKLISFCANIMKS